MSTLTGNRPISVVIFDRTQAGLSDVPIFAESLKKKVNTPIARELLDPHLSSAALTILEQIQHPHTENIAVETIAVAPEVLRADSSGGQTGEFAQSTASEVSDSVVSVPDEPVGVQAVKPVVPTIDLHDVLKQIEMPVIPTIRWSMPSFNLYGIASKVMLAGAMVLMFLTVGPVVVMEFQSYKQKISYAVTNLPTKAEDIMPTPVPTVHPAPEKQFQIIIPRIGVDSKVIANVDPSNEKEYTAALKQGIAHAAGSGLPGEANTDNKTIFFFGHSTNGEWNIAKYNALFYALKDMIAGDRFTVWFWGKEYQYQVTETKIVPANDIQFLTPQTETDQIILQTCWPPGTSWKRFLVIAKPV